MKWNEKNQLKKNKNNKHHFLACYIYANYYYSLSFLSLLNFSITLSMAYSLFVSLSANFWTKMKFLSPSLSTGLRLLTMSGGLRNHLLAKGSFCQFYKIRS